MIIRGSNNRGLILVAALWIVAILSLLAIGLAHRISLELRLVRFSRDSLRARFAAQSAVEFASRVLAQDVNNFDSMNEFWATGKVWQEEASLFKDYELKNAKFSIINEARTEENKSEILYGLSDEDSKLNINTATISQLEAFFREQGFENGREIAYSILDWIDQDEITSFEGAEDNYYRGLNPAYNCKNAPLAVIEELLFIKGMDFEKFEKIKTFVTVYGDGKININTASETVLSSLLISRGTLESSAKKLASEVSEYRLGKDGRLGTADDLAFVKFEDIALALSTPLSLGEFRKCVDAIKFKSDIFGAQIRAESSGAKRQARVLLRKQESGIKMPEIIFWHEG